VKVGMKKWRKERWKMKEWEEEFEDSEADVRFSFHNMGFP
jgi:hypothetical protein